MKGKFLLTSTRRSIQRFGIMLEILNLQFPQLKLGFYLHNNQMGEEGLTRAKSQYNRRSSEARFPGKEDFLKRNSDCNPCEKCEESSFLPRYQSRWIIIIFCI